MRHAWFLCGAALWLDPTAALAQETDPLSDLEELPDLGIAWPEAPGDERPDAIAIDGNPDAAPAPVEPGTPRYTITLTGVPDAVDGDIRSAFDGLSNLEQGDGEAETVSQVDRRAQADALILAELMRAEGYYAATVTPRTRAHEGWILVTLEVEAGPVYRFETVALPGIEATGAEEASALRAIFGIREGGPVRAEEVIAARARIEDAMGRRGYALAEIGEQQIVIDHDTQSASLTLPVDPGLEAQFGAIRVSGAPPFPDKHVTTLARFEPGDTYDSTLVGDLRRALIQTGLIGDIEIVENVEDGVVDLDINLSPAPPRTISGAAGFQTGEGLRAEASWTHRNFFNPEGALTLTGVVGTQEQRAGVLYRRSNWKQRDRILTAQLIAGNIERDAYQSKFVGLGAGVERVTNFLWQKPWVWSLEAEMLALDERDRLPDVDFTFERAFFIAAIGGALRYDGTDSLLDPTSGFRLGGRLSPELSVELDTFTLAGDQIEAGTRETYLRAEVEGSAYWPANENLVIAGRAKVATIWGAVRDNIAPSRRFYAGGGSSVRGYGYQQLGPKDVVGDPIGGRSLTEFSLEARYRFGADRQFGIVPFIDAGRLSSGPWPGTRDWQFGVGVGARYYSSFGPIRLDVGTPINRQEGDSRIAVVVSLGQAF
ncbi:autotransporter assembly complex protein TamA [Sphingomicrobium clamense]|uniref:BamA/TamA family outer membrane protein n=1 Tax=Sphingomicrobium clamense TaxID=2851013 RepID=A0ABS6V7D8_9SPHN|nr:BamA/TamA family outer membrane protein [Sphingomicrobium sp. B8]MBW0145419.1 BamA/TamA family outer membrane protein [Sphingomicrobium sp. B8]